ncbi:MAG: Hsp70 family protein [Pirellulales bacterium]
MPAEFVVGIDLGTTNSALAFAPLGSDQPLVQLLEVPQLVSAGTVESRTLLPSFCYLGTAEEAKAGNFDLPWERGQAWAVGELARRQAAEAPMRTVAAAKSWLCYSRVDRRQAILPWNAPEEVPKVSPLTATERYLRQLAAAWNTAYPQAPIGEQQVVLTVPASFDASARELTRAAALAAGLPENLVLLEEPQAAVYAWLADQGDRWRKQLSLGDTLLVCDVGGGTTDFTLIRVAEEEGELVLKRAAVGNHILAGGDNMDLTLAHFVAGQFQGKGIELDPWQAVALWHSCRAAKETLFAAGGPKKHPVSVLGRGRKLVGGTVSVDVDRQAAAELLLEGFFPACELGAKPQTRRASGFREIGLPFESDTAVTRHLAAFLNAHGDGASAAQPTHVLFNGGVFKADAFRGRLLEVIGRWFGQTTPPRGLEGNRDLDHAVARGAAYYGFAKQGKGVRIRGGTARSYYIGIETAGLAIPGAPRPLRALCVAPFGMEEGTEADVPGEELALVVGEPALFRFFGSAVRKQDRPGDLLPKWTEDELSETDSLEATLPASEGASDGFVPVRIHSHVTELGQLELWCASTVSDHRWKLEFRVREDAEAG